MEESLSREYARAPRGHQVKVDINGRKSKRINLMAALNAQKTILEPFVIDSTIDSTIFNQWLGRCLIPTLKTGSTIIMDNSPIHKTKLTRQLIYAAQCRLLYLPTYSPDFNPIENTWAIIKARIKKIKHQFEHFYDAIDYVFQNN